MDVKKNLPGLEPLMDYWKGTGVESVLLNILNHANNGNNIMGGYSPDRLFIFVRNGNSPRCVIRIYFYNTIGFLALDIGYNWLLVRRGWFSEELSDLYQENEIATALIHMLCHVVFGSMQSNSSKYFAFWLNERVVSHEAFCRKDRFFTIKKGTGPDISLPLCTPGYEKAFIEILREGSQNQPCSATDGKYS